MIYLFLALIMRLSGKRQAGQLEVGELVTALLLSELAAFSIVDSGVPLSQALLPIALITLLEIAMSCLCALFPSFKRIFEGCPAVLIANGKIDKDALFGVRLSPDELLAQLRLKGVADPDEVDFAILEQNGQLSVILKSLHQPLTPRDLQKHPQDQGYARPLVVCGKINYSNLHLLGMTKRDLQKRLGKTPIRSVLLYTLNDAGHACLVLR